MRKLMLVTIVVLSVVAMPATALADKPVVYRADGIVESFTLTHCDASYGGVEFDIVANRTFDVVQTVFFDKDGNPDRVTVDFNHTQFTLTNTVTGKTVDNNFNLRYILDLAMVNGVPTAQTVTYLGRFWGLNIPGEGIVVLGTGIVVYDLTKPGPGLLPILFQGGPHPIDYEIPRDEAFCPWLAGD